MSNDQITPFASGAVTPGDKSAPAEKKRAVRRCQFVASAEVTELGSQTQLSARTSEIGLGGCYVDTLSPFPDGTIVSVRIIRDGGVFACQGKVVYVQDRFGMGIAFTEIAPDQRTLLQNWIAELVMQLK
jgi:PilZ domain